MVDTLRGDKTFTGTVTFTGSTNLPDGSISDDHVNAGAAIDADKLQHRHALNYAQADGSDVVTATQLLHVCRAAGMVVDVEARVTTAPTGGDKQFTVDIQKAVDGGSFSTILSAVLTFGGSDNTLQTATLSGTPTLADGDALRVVITASGSSGSQGQGVVVTVNIDEDAA